MHNAGSSDQQVIGKITNTCVLHADVSFTKNLKPKVTLETASLIIPQSLFPSVNENLRGGMLTYTVKKLLVI